MLLRPAAPSWRSRLRAILRKHEKFSAPSARRIREASSSGRLRPAPNPTYFVFDPPVRSRRLWNRLGLPGRTFGCLPGPADDRTESNGENAAGRVANAPVVAARVFERIEVLARGCRALLAESSFCESVERFTVPLILRRNQSALHSICPWRGCPAFHDDTNSPIPYYTFGIGFRRRTATNLHARR